MTRTSHVLNGMAINMDFIITPTFAPNSTTPLWTDFYQRVPWNTTLDPPRNLRVVTLVHQGQFIFRRCPPFFLEADPCSSWLEWTTIAYPVINDPPLKVLRIKPGKNPASIRNCTLICTQLNYDLYVTQLLAMLPPRDTAPPNNDELALQPCKLC